MKQLKKNKFLATAGGLFLLYNIIWFLYVTVIYVPLCDKLGQAFSGIRCVLREEEYTYSVKKPDYLSFTGNLCISENIDINENCDIAVDILIWPKGFGSYEVGISIEKMVFDTVNNKGILECTNMMLDENMMLLDNTSINQELYNQHIEEIRELYHLAYDKWGILYLE